jgi:hypothetical protein
LLYRGSGNKHYAPEQNYQSMLAADATGPMRQRLAGFPDLRSAIRAPMWQMILVPHLNTNSVEAEEPSAIWTALNDGGR